MPTATMKKYEKEPSTDTLLLDYDDDDDMSCSDDSVAQQDEDETHPDKKDMRWQLTDDEKRQVCALKKAADDEGLYYKNIFELAKYVLVVTSLESTADKRLEAALRRLRKRHAWLHKHNLLALDQVKVHTELSETVCAQHFVQCFVRERTTGRAVVATHMAHVPYTYIQQGSEERRKYLVAAMYRMDLGAVDLQEARQGMALATISERQFTLTRAWRYMRFMKSISPDMADMHPHTVKAVYAQFPSFVAHLLPAVKPFLPRKVADRIHVYGAVQDMAEHLEMTTDMSDKNRKSTGNKASAIEMSLAASDWARQRHKRLQETVSKLTLE